MASVRTRVLTVGLMTAGVVACGVLGGSGCSSSSTNAATPDASAPVDAGVCALHLPGGFTQVTSSASDTQAGTEVSMALDENDDPMFAYLNYATNDDATLTFIHWDKCAGAFTAPVSVDDARGVSASAGERQVSLAYDPSTKQVAIAYQKIVADPGKNDAAVIWLATRTLNGTTFATQQISEGEGGDTNDARTPSIAMHAGKTYVAYEQDNYACCASCGGCSGLWFLASSATAPAEDAGTQAGPLFFTHSLVQFAGGIAQPRADAVSVAIDGNGVPAVAFYEAPATGYNTTLAYWHSDQAAAVAVTDSNNIQNDGVDLSLAFEGTKPRVAGHLVAVTSATYDLTYASSADGVTWSAPVHIPQDGTAGTAFTSALAVDGTGKVAVAADTNTGSGDNKCSNPYLAQSSDDGATFSACGADTTNAHKYSVGSVNAAYGASRIKGTLALGFQNSNIQGETAGIVYWQQP